MKNLKTLLLIGCLVFLGASLMTPKAQAGEWNQKSFLTFERPVQLPGTVLPAGTYVFKLVDSIDRDVVQVFSQDERKLYATILTVPDYRENAADGTLIVFEDRSEGAPQAIKEWFFPDRRHGHEFVYPKTEPVELAKTEPAESAEPDITMEHSEQTAEPEASEYSRLLQQKQTESQELARSDQPDSQPADDAELMLQEEKDWGMRQGEQIPVQSAMIQELPRTAGRLPLVFLSGILLMAVSFGLRFSSKRL